MTGGVVSTPEQLQALREQLPTLGAGLPAPPELAAYCQYYGIDFTTRYPSVTHEVGHITSGDYTLAVHQWCVPAARANLLVLHGYFDHTGLFSKLIDWGLAHHCNVLIFDLPGHGLSSGDPAVIDDFGDYSRAIDDVLRAASLPVLPLWVMAQSTGGAALVDYAQKYDWPFAATVLLAPLVRPAGWRWVSPVQRVLSVFTDSIGRTFAVNSSDREFLAFIKRDPLQCHRISLRWLAALRRWLGDLQPHDLGVGPALVIQGDADGTVDWRYNMPVIAQLFPDSQIAYLPGAGHQLANESAAIREMYLQSVQSWLAECGILLNEPSVIVAS
ncbi:Monoacylglycerol lipase [Halioglobus japonicus]|nr:Monoacylglycerol lipase [Halioglobus japonicus]